MAEGLNAAGLQLGAAGPGIAPGIAYIQLHSDDPGTTGAHECTSSRQEVACTASAGVVTIPETAFTALEDGETVKCLGYWSAATSGTFYGYNTLVGDDAANAKGAYTVGESTITGSSK
jgi:hypothetical protein